MDGDSEPQNERPGAGTAFQGAPGAFSHEACVELRPWDDHRPFETFEAAIEAVRSGDCDCALIPIENSTIGDVEPAATLVRTSGLAIVGDAWRPIRMALMGLDGVELHEVRTVHSHPVALAQCVGNLGELDVELVEAFDTAGAAREVSEAGDRTRAALAPVAAAEVYGLSVLRHDLQDSADNRTRFVLLARDPA